MVEDTLTRATHAFLFAMGYRAEEVFVPYRPGEPVEGATRGAHYLPGIRAALLAAGVDLAKNSGESASG